MTLSTLDIERKHGRTALIYLLAAIFCGVFGSVYELFSHGVYSYYMIYAFAFPLVGGVLPFLILDLKNPRYMPSALAQGLYHAGIATCTIGSIIQGVLVIYGTTNSKTVIYWIAGAVLVTAGLLVYLMQSLRRKS